MTFNNPAEPLRFSTANSDGVHMTQEDYDFYLDADCSVGEHVTTRISFHDLVVEFANNFANGETKGFHPRKEE